MRGRNGRSCSGSIPHSMLGAPSGPCQPISSRSAARLCAGPALLADNSTPQKGTALPRPLSPAPAPPSHLFGRAHRSLSQAPSSGRKESLDGSWPARYRPGLPESQSGALLAELHAAAIVRGTVNVRNSARDPQFSNFFQPSDFHPSRTTFGFFSCQTGPNMLYQI